MAMSASVRIPPEPDTQVTNAPTRPLLRQASLADQAYGAIREMIATGELTPGQRLTERRLALLLGVSPTPVREALRRLQQEGLIAHQTPRVLTVVNHSDEVLRELLFGAAVLRAAIARIATAKITDAAINAMAAIVDQLATVAAEASPAEVLSLAARFDDILENAADSPALQTLAAGASVFGQARRARAVAAMRVTAQDVGQRHLAAHRAIVAALRARDADEVERQVRHLMLSSLDLLLSDLEAPT
jgi:DNA-binding GntR family transcriptional regulator